VLIFENSTKASQAAQNALAATCGPWVWDPCSGRMYFRSFQSK